VNKPNGRAYLPRESTLMGKRGSWQWLLLSYALILAVGIVLILTGHSAVAAPVIVGGSVDPAWRLAVYVVGTPDKGQR
jgi:hypothetical protein